MAKIPKRHNWIGKYCRFIREEHVAEFNACPNTPLAEENGWVLRGKIIAMEATDKVGKIKTYLCTVQSMHSPKTLTVNSTLQYLRIINDG